jgi:hypothetical protein
MSIKRKIMTAAGLLLFAASLWLSLWLGLTSSQAQFPGYPDVGQVELGNGPSAPPSWQDNPAALKANNLSDLASASSARTNLGLGSIATQNANAVAITGGTVTGLPAPTATADAATKQYVDNLASGVAVHNGARLASAAALPPNTYANGTAGVGATLTATGNGALFVDSVAVATSDRILVKNEAAAANNGIYVVTNTGSAGAAYVLTRATDANTTGVADSTKIGVGSYVLVTVGNTLANTGWIVNAPVTTIGTSAIVWAQFSAASTGLASLNGATGAVTLKNGGGMNVNTVGSNITLSTPITPPQGRLTLQTGLPVMTTSVAATSTIYYDCYHGGNAVPIYAGTTDTFLAIPSCEISLTMATSGTGLINATDVFDVWAVNSSGLKICVATNGLGAGWIGDTGGSATARGSGYSALDTTFRPYITNRNALTHCYAGAIELGSVANNQATYLGTFRTIAVGQTAFIFGATNGTISQFMLWNAYNRVPVSGVTAASVSYSYGVFSGWRVAAGFVQVVYVYGLNEDTVKAIGQQTFGGNVPGAPLCVLSIGIDAITPNSTTLSGSAAGAAASLFQTAVANYRGYPGVGVHTIYMLETNGSGSGTCLVNQGSGLMADLNM